MSKEELIEKLTALVAESPSEESHMQADALLLRYIDDPEITAAFHAIEMWYA